MTDHPLTDQESDKYLQMGWTWAAEHMIGWLDKNLHDILEEYVCHEYAFSRRIIEELKKEMLPQEDN